MSKATIIIGGQWGDEGKGKIVDYLAASFDMVVRFNGGNNAGHTVVYKGVRLPLSHLPCGVLWNKKLLIAQGSVINPKVILEEIDYFNKAGKLNLMIDPRVNIVMPYHQELDAATEEAKGDKKVGSLKLGIGYCYEDRNNRHGIRLEDLVEPAVFKKKLEEEVSLKKKRIEAVYNYKVEFSVRSIFQEYVAYGRRLKKYLGDVSLEVAKNIDRRKVLFEGAHGTFLDANFGTYPFTTAVNTIAGSVFSSVGFPPGKLLVVGVVKAYTTRVGGGPFPSELKNGIGQYIQEKGAEFGTVSKRKRRCGWLDIPMLKLAHRLNGFDYLAITKLDVLSGIINLGITTHYLLKNKKIDEFPTSLADVYNCRPIVKQLGGWEEDISSVRRYQDLPLNCRNYLKYIENKLEVPIKYISLGAERSAIIKI